MPTLPGIVIYRAALYHTQCNNSYLTVALPDITNPILLQIGRIIHGADITADADETLDSPGIDLPFRGLRLISENDEQALER
jgi:hypothetical protein